MHCLKADLQWVTLWKNNFSRTHYVWEAFVLFINWCYIVSHCIPFISWIVYYVSVLFVINPWCSHPSLTLHCDGDFKIHQSLYFDFYWYLLIWISLCRWCNKYLKTKLYLLWCHVLVMMAWLFLLELKIWLVRSNINYDLFLERTVNWLDLSHIYLHSMLSTVI